MRDGLRATWSLSKRIRTPVRGDDSRKNSKPPVFCGVFVVGDNKHTTSTRRVSSEQIHYTKRLGARKERIRRRLVGGGQKQGQNGGLNKATAAVAGCSALRHARGLSSGRRFAPRRWTMRFGLPRLECCVMSFGMKRVSL